MPDNPHYPEIRTTCPPGICWLVFKCPACPYRGDLISPRLDEATSRICPRCRLPWGTDEHDIAGCGQDPK